MEGIKYTDIMGPNVLDKLKYCGKNVRVYDLAKICNPQWAELDDNCLIFDYAFIDARNSLKIGKYSIIGWHCVVEGGANICIGDRCFLGPGAKLLCSTYEYDGVFTSQLLPKGAYSIKYGDITIEDDAYVGAGTVVMPGITIGEGALVGANSLVDRDLKPWTIYHGNPVKKVGERERPTEEHRKIIESMDWTKHF
ncbi:acyltransferase [Bacteroides uniformis]|uniref:acyltransferase n=1 Tax=Bacteroides uniformis TaxID=820 RepID=UPI00203026A0|nr:acyltransferase [Bacteroides uniformis]MCM1955884.1 acyltransferase [Bacteroides uniformis]